jgi:signal transduction histidine kinase
MPTVAIWRFKNRDSHYHEGMKTRRMIEPRILTLFRLFLGVILGLAIPVLFVSVVILNVPIGRFQIFSLVILVGLFIYLSVPRLMGLFGRFYLPIAIIIASIVPLLSTRLVQSQLLTEGRLIIALSELEIIQPDNRAALSSGDSWVIFLFVPLVFVAWQYNLRSVLFFSIGTALVDLGISMRLFRAENEHLLALLNTISSRTVAFMLIGFIVVRLVARQREQQDELTEANSKLTNYAATLENFAVSLEQLTISRERNRLARELHDTLAHTLSALSVQLEATDTLWKTNPEQSRQLLQDALATTRSGLTETRRALQALRASPLDDLGLALAVRSMAESAAERSGFSVQVDIPAQFNDLSPQVEQTVYRVIQESLENITRHAAAKHVSLSLRRDHNKVTALVMDDGIGFDAQTMDQDRRLGLRGMRERVEMLGGIFDIQSAVGKGTTIRVVLNEALI